MKISKEKIDRIKEEVLSVLYRNSPKALFTVEIAAALIRDEEFTKKLLLELESQKLISSVNKNSNGINYLRRLRWRLSTKAFEAYNTIENQKIKYNEMDNTYV